MDGDRELLDGALAGMPPGALEVLAAVARLEPVGLDGLYADGMRRMAGRNPVAESLEAAGPWGSVRAWREEVDGARENPEYLHHAVQRSLLFDLGHVSVAGLLEMDADGLLRVVGWVRAVMDLGPGPR